MNLDCVILAAGAASRFGSCKLSEPYQGQPVISYAIAAVQSLSPARIVVVSGAHHQQLKMLSVMTAVELHYCEHWQQGMGYSLSFGVRQLENANPVMILLADQPHITSNDVQCLWRAWNAHPEKIICARFGNVLGVPAIFPAHCKSQLMACAGDRGAKHILLSCADDRIDIEMPNAAFDIDVPDDLHRPLANV